MLRTIWSDNARYLETYWSKFQNRYYVAGDSAHRDADGYFWIMGRVDDVLNVAGHRLGTMEIESALVAHPRVAEAAVVGKPHEVKGEAVFAFVVCRGERPRGDTSALVEELRAMGGRAGRRDRQAGRHPLRGQPAQDPLGQDHAPAAALHRARKRHHGRHLDAGESRRSSTSCAESTRLRYLAWAGAGVAGTAGRVARGRNSRLNCTCTSSLIHSVDFHSPWPTPNSSRFTVAVPLSVATGLPASVPGVKVKLIGTPAKHRASDKLALAFERGAFRRELRLRRRLHAEISRC